MAIGRAAARLLVIEASKIGFRGRLLQLGPQKVYLTGRELQTYADEVGLALVEPPEADNVLVDADQFFAAIGFEQVESCDLFDQSATHRFDLNDPVPDDLRGQFDAVFDGGTMEHIFDTGQVLRNVHDLLAPRGLAIHLSPANNWVDHGFYAFSPRFFASYYPTNGYTVEAAWLLRHSRRWQRGRWHAFAYVLGALDRRADGGFEKGMLLNFVVARRGPVATSGTAPQQDFTPRTVNTGGGHLMKRVVLATPLVRRALRALAPDRFPSDVLTIVPRRSPGKSRVL
jgi:SAM-dependent methyltransferase